MRPEKYLLVLSFFSLIFFSTIFKINDPDTVHYLASGKYILQNGLYTKCPFSYANPNCQINPTEWLFHVITYVIYVIGQWNLMVVIQTLLVVLIFLIVFLCNRHYQHSFFSSVFFMFLACLIAWERYMLRADVFGLLIAVVFYFLLRLGSEQFFTSSLKNKALNILSLLILQVIWANTHGSFPLGIIIVSAYFFGELFNSLFQRYFAKNNVAVFSHKTVYFGLLTILCVFVSFISPYGSKSFFWPFSFFFGNSNFYNQAEFESPFTPRNLPYFSVEIYKILIISVISIVLLNIKKIKLVDFFILIPLFYLSAKFIRNIALFSLFCALILPRYLDNLVIIFNKYKEKMIKKSFLRQRIYSFFQLFIIFAWIILVIILDYQIITNKFYLREQKSRRFGFGLSEISFPIKAADFIEQNNLQGNFFNGYGVGGYLNWRLFPKHKTFIDGQTYTLNSLNYYYGVLRNEITIANAAKKYNINYFILNYPNQNILDLVPQFYIKEDWKLIYFDEITAIFIVNKLKNKDIINKYEIDFKTNKNMFSNNLISLKDKVNYSSGYVNRGRFFFTLELWENAKDQFLKAIEADPENYVALSNLGATYQMLGKNDLAFDALRKSIKLYSHYSSSHYNLAVWYHKKNMFDEAKKEYIKTLEINGSHSLAKYYLGLIYSSPRFSP